MPTDTSERCLESLIVDSLVNDAGYALGDSKTFDREHCVDWPTLLGFLKATQAGKVERLHIEADIGLDAEGDEADALAAIVEEAEA